MPLSQEESRTRREFAEAVPVRRRRDWVIAAVIGTLVVGAVAAAMLTDGMGGDAPSLSRPSEAERSLRVLVPEAFRSSCSRPSSSPPNATASVDCVPDEQYSVTYASFGSADDLGRAFEQFASPADPTNIDCARDPSGAARVHRQRHSCG